jgi:small neutral amino acid transporter SnatA (MarC family)
VPEFQVIVILALIAALIVSLFLMIGTNFTTKYIPQQILHATSRVFAFILAALIVSLLLMVGTNFTTKYIPQQILHATSRVFAFILAALATQFIIDGIKASFNI